MKQSTSDRRQSSGRRRSSSSVIDPYLIEDVAMTPGELERWRGETITVVGLRWTHF